IGLVGSIAGGVGAGAVDVDVQQRVFAVVTKKLEAHIPVAAAQREKIVDRGPAIGDGRVVVAAIINDQHVVDHVFDIEQVLQVRVEGSVRVFSLKRKISRVGA